MNRKDYRPNKCNSKLSNKDIATINKYKVTKKTIKGYYGMNHNASKEINATNNKHLPTPTVNEVYVAKSLTGKTRRKVIAHEVHENELMKHGLHYKKAHKKSLRYERKVN